MGVCRSRFVEAMEAAGTHGEGLRGACSPQSNSKQAEESQSNQKQPGQGGKASQWFFLACIR